MRALLAAALALAGLAAPAAAHMVEVTTSVNLTEVTDHGQLTQALQSAVDSVLSEAIAFRPTLVVLTRTLVVGERLYLRLLIADRDGERTLSELGSEPESAPEIEELKI